jgi:hypothetical protein
MSAPLVVASAVAILGVLWVPGLAMTYALQLRGIGAFAVAPALSCSLLGCSAAIAAYAGVRWSPWLLLLATLVGVLVARVVARVVTARLGAAPRPDRRRVRRAAVVGTLVGAAFLGFALWRAIGSWSAVPAQPDATYHLNSIRSMLVTGDLSSRDGGAFLYGRAHSFYPSTFQGVAATAGMVVHAQPVVLANLLAVLAPALVWTSGCVLLARQLFGPSRAALVLSGLATSSFTAMPFLIAGYGPLWPLLLGLSLLPGLLGPLLSLFGLAADDVLGRPRAAVVLVAAVAGLAFVHPDALASLVVLAYVIAVVVAVRALVRGRRSAGRSTVLAAIAVVAPPLLWVAVLQLPRARAMSRAYRVGPVVSHGRGVADALLNRPYHSSAALWVTSAVAVLGVVVCARRRRLRWVAVAYVALALVYVGVVAVQDRYTRALTVYWYNDPPRLAALVPVAAVPALTAGLLALSGHLQGLGPSRTWRGTRRGTRRRAGAGSALLVALVFVVATLGNNHGAQVSTLRPYYHPRDPGTALLTPQEAGALQVLARSIPVDAVVADNPWRGHALLYAFTSRRVVFFSEKAVTTPERAVVADALFLAASPLRPDVCPAVRAVGATYVITGGRNQLPNRGGRDQFLGVDLVPGRPGFTLVARSAPYALWRITACG